MTDRIFSAGRRAATAADIEHKRLLRRVLGEARGIRVDLQDLLLTLDQIDTAAALTDEAVRTQALADAIRAANKRLGHSSPDIKKRLDTIFGLFEVDADLNDQLSDQFEQIANNWERVLDAWIGGVNAVPASAVTISLNVRPLLDNMIRLIGRATIPPRLQQRLLQMHVGETLDFKDEFGEELPDEDLRIEVLKHLKSHAKLVDGVVSVEEQSILRTSRSIKQGLLTLLLTLVLALLPFVALYLDRTFSSFDETFFKEDEVGQFTNLYAWVLIGAAAHFIVALIKSGRSGQTLVLARDVGAFSAKQGAIVIGVISLWALSYGAWRGFGEFDRDTAFFAGYSFDSFIDIVLTRFETSVNLGTEKIKKQLASVPAPS